MNKIIPVLVAVIICFSVGVMASYFQVDAIQTWTVHIISWVGNDGMRSFAEWLEANFQWVTLNKLLSLGVAFFSAFTMFNWWLSYRLFTRSQVIKPKFRLL